MARNRTAHAVYDIEATPTVNRRLAAIVGAKSAAFVPLIADRRVTGVLVVVAKEHRFFSTAELDEMQRRASEAAHAFGTAQSAAALRSALERERLVTEIARKVRSGLDVDAILDVAVAETGRALGASRAFIRLGVPGEPMPIHAEWSAPGLEPIGELTERLAVSNLAVRERRTVTIANVAAAPELDDESLGGRDALLSLGTRSALGTPIVVFDRSIGVFGLDRPQEGFWSNAEVSLAETIAAEAGVAVHAARLLDEDDRRLGQQTALLRAAQVVTSDLRFESVLRRLVEGVANLVRADAVDCWMFEPDHELLRCRAVLGLPSSELRRRIPPEGTHRAAIESGKPVLKTDWGESEDPQPSPNYRQFAECMVAPITWLGEVRGVLGVLTRERGAFDSSELELIDAFARFASLAFHNAESFEERERQARIQQGFYRIAEVLGSPLSLAETLNALAQAAAEALGGAAAVVLHPDEDRLRFGGAYRLPPTFAERLADGVAATATPFLDAAREERIVSSSGVADDDRFDEEWRGLLAEHRYLSLLSAPVAGASGENHAVVVLFGQERSFSDEDLALARHLSRAARGALERSELFETERRARSLSQQLADVGARLAMNLDPAVVLEEVVGEAPALLAADAAAIRLLEGDELVVGAAAGAGAAGLVGMRSASGTGIAGEVAQSRTSSTVEDVRTASHLSRGDPLLGKRAGASVAVPMFAHGGGLHGVLSVYTTSARSWSEDEV
ncbi:MAG: GAF domain-containing protein, partial [Actinobacteria bacterium]|nr:GAF domain-containing protein [Actinomycetota bacterium]